MTRVPARSAEKAIRPFRGCSRAPAAVAGSATSSNPSGNARSAFRVRGTDPCKPRGTADVALARPRPRLVLHKVKASWMRTFWRLLGFLRPYRGGGLASFSLAAAAMGTGVLIPYLVGRTVDEIRHGGARLWPLALAVVAAALLRLAFSVVRRLVAGRVSLGVEYDLRNRIYGHLHSLELAFFDSQQTGQLMSRSTVDLQAVRFFLGYGLIFILQSALTILIAAGVMFAVDAGLAAVSLAPMPIVIWVAFRYGRLNRPA